MSLISVGSLPLHDISKYSVKRQDLDGPDSSRSETGYLTRERIREGVYTIEIGLSHYTDSELNSLITELAKVSIDVSFFFGTQRSISAYSSNQTIDLKANPEDGSHYWDISFNLIEY